jgi:hypothetical protein
MLTLALLILELMDPHGSITPEAATTNRLNVPADVLIPSVSGILLSPTVRSGA